MQCFSLSIVRIFWWILECWGWVVWNVSSSAAVSAGCCSWLPFCLCCFSASLHRSTSLTTNIQSPCTSLFFLISRYNPLALMMLFKEFPYQKLPKFNRDCTNLVQIINVRIKFKVVVEYCLRNRKRFQRLVPRVVPPFQLKVTVLNLTWTTSSTRG